MALLIHGLGLRATASQEAICLRLYLLSPPLICFPLLVLGLVLFDCVVLGQDVDP